MVTQLYGRDAELYDIAFDWDISAEVDWLLSRLGPGCATLLEPGCGSGRMLESFARRGIVCTGLDRSPQMVALARRRLAAAGADTRVVQADMADFDLGERFGGGVCPINTLVYLTPAALGGHLACMARHLAGGGRYLVQVDVHAADGSASDLEPAVWEAEREGTRLEVTWQVESVDLARGRELQRSRIEVLSGPRCGTVVEECHDVTSWTALAWQHLVVASPLEQVGQYDGNEPGQPAVPIGRPGPLMWHELALP